LKFKIGSLQKFKGHEYKMPSVMIENYFLKLLNAVN